MTLHPNDVIKPIYETASIIATPTQIVKSFIKPIPAAIQTHLLLTGYKSGGHCMSQGISKYHAEDALVCFIKQVSLSAGIAASVKSPGPAFCLPFL